MKKTPNVIFYILNSKTGLSHTTRNHTNYANRIVCEENDLLEFNAQTYVQKQMASYPLTKQINQKNFTADETVKKHKRETATILMRYAYEFTVSSNYLLFEETRQFLNTMNDTELRENQMTLEMLRRSICDCLENQDMPDYAASEINALLRDIADIQDRKSSKIS